MGVHFFKARLNGVPNYNFLIIISRYYTIVDADHLFKDDRKFYLNLLVLLPIEITFW